MKRRASFTLGRMLPRESCEKVGRLVLVNFPELSIGSLGLWKGPHGDDRHEFVVHKPTVQYFTNDEFNAVAWYVHGAADAIEPATE